MENKIFVNDIHIKQVGIISVTTVTEIIENNLA